MGTESVSIEMTAHITRSIYDSQPFNTAHLEIRTHHSDHTPLGSNRRLATSSNGMGVILISHPHRERLRYTMWKAENGLGQGLPWARGVVVVVLKVKDRKRKRPLIKDDLERPVQLTVL